MKHNNKIKGTIMARMPFANQLTQTEDTTMNDETIIDAPADSPAVDTTIDTTVDIPSIPPQSFHPTNDPNDFVPSNWTLTEEDGVLKGINTITTRTFEGTMDDFNTLLRN